MTKYYNGKFEVSDHTFALTGFKGYDVRYIYQWMRSNYEYIHSLAHGTGIPGINTKDLGGIDITLPKSLSEQTRIANVLSDYDSLIDVLNSEIDNLKNTKSQLMQDIFQTA